MKIILLSTYWPCKGGGESHFGKLCEVLSRKNEVELIYNGCDFILENEKQFNLDLSRCKRTRLEQGKFSEYSKNADLFISYNHHIEVFPRGRKNVLFCTIPFFKYPNMTAYHSIIANSNFTADFLRTKFHNVEVLYPHIDRTYNCGNKKNLILTVGRFNQDLHCKRQLELVREFKNASIDFGEFRDWNFVVAGGAKFNSEIALYNKCKELAKQNPRIDVLCNLSFSEIIKLNSMAKLYWHATGYGEVHPEKMEHFGMAVISAMASGCVPLIVNKGEPQNIVGYEDQVWSDWDDLIDKTRWWINHPVELSERASIMIAKSRQYSESAFASRVQEVFSKFGVSF